MLQGIYGKGIPDYAFPGNSGGRRLQAELQGDKAMKKCHVCGYAENGGKFCNKCGAPLQENGDAGESAKDQKEAKNEKAAPPPRPGSMREYRQELPALAPEAELLEVCISGHSSGMMYNSDSRFSISAAPDGDSCSVTFKEKKSFAAVETKEVYRGYPDMLRDIRGILIEADFQEADRRIPDDARAGPLVFDYSSGYSLSFKWRPVPGNSRYEYFSINSDKIAIAKKNDDLKRIREVLNSAMKEESLILREEKDLNINRAGIIGMMTMTGAPAKTSQPQKTLFPGMSAAGSWTCPDCGETGLAGRFCCQCGRKRPE